MSACSSCAIRRRMRSSSARCRTAWPRSPPASRRISSPRRAGRVRRARPPFRGADPAAAARLLDAPAGQDAGAGPQGGGRQGDPQAVRPHDHARNAGIRLFPDDDSQNISGSDLVIVRHSARNRRAIKSRFLRWSLAGRRGPGIGRRRCGRLRRCGRIPRVAALGFFPDWKALPSRRLVCGMVPRAPSRQSGHKRSPHSRQLPAIRISPHFAESEIRSPQLSGRREYS